MVAFLGYALWATLKHLLQRRIEFWRTTGIRGMRRRPELSGCAAAGAGGLSAALKQYRKQRIYGFGTRTICDGPSELTIPCPSFIL
jgi:hypothetical protein